MNVQCPSCQIRLSIDYETLKTKGTLLKCTKCRAVFLVVQKPPALHKKMLARGKITAIKDIKPAEPEKNPLTKTTLEEKIEKAKMLAKTILSDLYHYNPSKAEESIRNNNFYTIFEPELKEGLNLYESRIPLEVREGGDFFREALEDFIRNRKNLYNL